MSRLPVHFVLFVVVILIAATAFGQGNVVVYRVGDGSAALASNATAVFLEERAPDGSLVRTIAMPTTTAGAQHALTTSGSATSERLMTRSADGLYLIVPGYNAAPGTASITTSASGTINRVIGRVDAAGAVDTTTAVGDAGSPGNQRGATSTDGVTMWMTTSAGGIRAVAFGSSWCHPSLTLLMTRGVAVPSPARGRGWPLSEAEGAGEGTPEELPLIRPLPLATLGVGATFSPAAAVEKALPVSSSLHRC